MITAGPAEDITRDNQGGFAGAFGLHTVTVQIPPTRQSNDAQLLWVWQSKNDHGYYVNCAQVRIRADEAATPDPPSICACSTAGSVCLAHLAQLYNRTPISNNNLDVVGTCTSYTNAELQGINPQCSSPTVCPGGTVGAILGAAGSCTPCKAGSYRPANLGTEVCAPCPANTVSSGGASVCIPCEDGKESVYKAEAKVSVCEFCPAGRTGKSGKCNECLPGYFAQSPAHQCVRCDELEGEIPKRYDRLNIRIGPAGRDWTKSKSTSNEHIPALDGSSLTDCV